MTNPHRLKCLPRSVAHYRKQSGEWHALPDHLIGTARVASICAQKLGFAKLGELLGLLHDLGKYSHPFQVYLLSALGQLNQDEDDEWVDAKALQGKLDHSTAGAQFAWHALKERGPMARLTAQLIALCVASHHSGLIDCISGDAVRFGQDGFTKRMDKALDKTHLEEVRVAADPAILKRCDELLDDPELQDEMKRLLLRISASNAPATGAGALAIAQQQGLLVRFFFSCLIDGDRVDTANFANPIAEKFRPSGAYAAWPVLIARLEEHLAGIAPRYAIDALRRDISEHCLRAATRPSGIYTLTVPTGGGKTLASLRFALHHARERKLDRIIYVIPFTSIIDQNAPLTRAVLEPASAPNDAARIVLEHHASLTPERQTWREKILCENWDAPVVYTTMVQFLETLFGAGTRGARRMHQLANAVVIFDEVQTLPIKCVHLFNNAINFLAEQCNSTLVLCTATQPLLHLVDRGKGATRLAADHEIMPNVRQLFDDLRRVEVRDVRKPGGWSAREVATLALNEIDRFESVLVVVNTKAAAQEIYRVARTLSGEAILYHLSTDMCPAHRRTILKTIRSDLKEGRPILCVSTQLIEAGVDVDFDSVIRFMAGLDSIAQAAGRCNRSGRREQGIVYLVNPVKENLQALPEIAAGIKMTERVLADYAEDPSRYAANVIGPEAMRDYYRYYFFERAGDMSYDVPRDEIQRDDNLLELLSCNTSATSQYGRVNGQAPHLVLRQAFMTAAKAFEVIDAPTQAVVVPYGDAGTDVVNDLYASYDLAHESELLRRTQQYTVNVFPHVLATLRAQNAVREVKADLRILCLDPQHYSPAFGLSVDRVSPMEPLHD